MDGEHVERDLADGDERANGHVAVGEVGDLDGDGAVVGVDVGDGAANVEAVVDSVSGGAVVDLDGACEATESVWRAEAEGAGGLGWDG